MDKNRTRQNLKKEIYQLEYRLKFSEILDEDFKEQFFGSKHYDAAVAHYEQDKKELEELKTQYKNLPPPPPKQEKLSVVQAREIKNLKEYITLVQDELKAYGANGIVSIQVTSYDDFLERKKILENPNLIQNFFMIVEIF